MHSLIPVVVSWSGGKDSMLALHRILQENKYDVRYLLTTVNKKFGRVSMHGVRTSLLSEQADSLDIPLKTLEMPELPTIGAYEATLNNALMQFKLEGISHIVFGDIFLEDLKQYRETQVAQLGMSAVFPLWGSQSEALIAEFIDLGYETIVVCSQDGLQEFCGRVIDRSFVSSLPDRIDPCGENGEFHTYVFNGPMLKSKINFEIGERVFKTFPNPNQSKKDIGYWYIDLI
ncbi:Dph6-related ATP pyrophosphatase [Pedobacter namyangjuensis]|uniref:Dph6-related ATP pyrophosphatase n=1 Tax=Pedobacter namyangjuensis TaxID=600626 RepID=UPI000DE3C030|nr:ATP-binding protein [Pedobacter namyangjuensis]